MITIYENYDLSKKISMRGAHNLRSTSVLSKKDKQSWTTTMTKYLQYIKY